MDSALNHQKKLGRLAIGTAQFGLHYGISNQQGQTSQSQANDVLAMARRYGINTLDTARLYGNSEETIGQCPDSNQFRIISKIAEAAENEKSIPQWIESEVSDSLDKLGQTQLYGLLLHRPDQLYSARGDAIIQGLNHLKQQGLVRKTGVSLYSPDALPQLLEKTSIDLVQLPLNIFDRRLITSGWLQRLSDAGIEVHVRSAFLQGLLLMPAAKRPNYFKPWLPLLTHWDTWLKSHAISPLEACLKFVLSSPEISRVVVGVENALQLQQIINACQGELPEIPDGLVSEDSQLINPHLWKIE